MTGPDGRSRRWIVGLSAVGAADSILVSLRQIGAISHLPDPPGDIFDSDAVTTSRPAYALGVPDAVLATAMYISNVLLAGRRWRSRQRLVDRVLLLSAIAGAAGATAYLGNMLFARRRLCSYCLTAIAINLALVPLNVASSRRRT